MIKAFFKSFGITIATSGTQDNLIHCCKKAHSYADGKSTLDEKLHQFHNDCWMLILIYTFEQED